MLRSGTVLTSLILCLVLIAILSVFLLYLFVPGGQALPEVMFGEGVFGLRQKDLTVLVDGQKQTVRVYVADLHPDWNRPFRQQTVLLTGLLLKPRRGGDLEVANWKVGRDYIGATNDRQEVFCPGWWGLIAGESIHITYPLEDGRTGMNAEYTIVDGGPSLDYAIDFPPGKGTRSVLFSIPKELFGIENKEDIRQEPLHILPVKKLLDNSSSSFSEM